MLPFLFAILALFGLSLGRPLERRGYPPLGVDPFYDPPAGFESTAPGTLLRNRTVQVATFGFFPQPFQADQLLYRTTSTNGSAIVTATTLYRPANHSKDEFITYATAEDAASAKCAPSYIVQLGNFPTNLIAGFESNIALIYAYLGYAVNLPDYEGPDSAFTAGRLAGTAVLDSIRAVKSFQGAGLNADAKVVGAGYSGGGLAMGWAAALQPVYAPELNVAGWSIGGVPANLTSTILKNSGHLGAGFISAAIAGLSTDSAYPRLQPLIANNVTAEGQSRIEFARNNCGISCIIRDLYKSVLDTTFSSYGPALLQQPDVAYVLNDLQMGNVAKETPTAPLLVIHAVADELIPYDSVVQLVDTYCNRGASVDFISYESGGHISTEILGLPSFIDFAQRAFAGNLTTKGCTSSMSGNNTLDPIALGSDLEPLLFNLVDALGALGGADQSNYQSDPSVVEQLPFSHAP